MRRNVSSGSPFEQPIGFSRAVRIGPMVSVAADDVIHTRVFLRDVTAWRDAGRAHGEVFGAIKPACTFVGATLIDPDWLVEIEADAFLSLRAEHREPARP
jgi:enamine deaminase RidA (YjgF/YER057c/UK114 family)